MAYVPIEDGDPGSEILEKLNTGLGLADSALQPGDAATPEQGALAATAVQPAALIPITPLVAAAYGAR